MQVIEPKTTSHLKKNINLDTEDMANNYLRLKALIGNKKVRNMK